MEAGCAVGIAGAAESDDGPFDAWIGQDRPPGPERFVIRVRHNDRTPAKSHIAKAVQASFIPRRSPLDARRRRRCASRLIIVVVLLWREP